MNHASTKTALLAVALLSYLSALCSPAWSETLSRIAFGSCLGQNEPQPIWKSVFKTEPHLFLFLGDNVYADTDDEKKLRSAYARLAGHRDYQALRRRARVMAVWDDHDYGFNDVGGSYPEKEMSQRVFLDFLEVPADSPRRRQRGVYDAAIIGPPGRRVQVIMLDTRYFRSDLRISNLRGPYVPVTDPSATMLGREQWEWLKARLLEPAEIRFLVSSIQVVAEEHGSEKWANFPNERARLFKLIRETKASGVVVLSGDRHHAELSVVTTAAPYPIYDLTSSSLNRSIRTKSFRERNRYRVVAAVTDDNFGLITIDWEKRDPTIKLQIRDVKNNVRIGKTIVLSELRGR